MPTAIMLIIMRQIGDVSQDDNDAKSLLMCITLHLLYIIAGSSLFKNWTRSIIRQTVVFKNFMSMMCFQFSRMCRGMCFQLSRMCRSICSPCAFVWDRICNCLHLLFTALLQRQQQLVVLVPHGQHMVIPPLA